MVKFSNLLPLLQALGSLVLVELVVFEPKQVYLAASLLVGVNIVVGYLICHGHKQKYWWNFIILPVVANLVSLGYFMIVFDNYDYLIHYIVTLLTIFNYTYWRFAFFFITGSSRYTSFSLENLSFYVNFLSVFLLGSLLFALGPFLGVGLRDLLAVALVFLWLISYQTIWVGKYELRQVWPYFLVLILVMLQLFGALRALPLDFGLLAFFWASAYYVLISLINNRLKHSLTKGKFRIYLIVTLVSWLVLLLSAKWL